MRYETRIITAPNQSRWKHRKWYWAVQRRYYDTSYAAPSVKVYGSWYTAAYGYARNESQADSRARLWLDEEALTKRIAEAKRQAAIDRVNKQQELTTITYIEEK
jgi:hypothetical protein